MDREELRLELIRDEGNIPWAYDDATGKPIQKGVAPEGYVTAGVGFLLDHGKGGRIPQPVVDYWLDYLIDGLEGELKTIFPAWERMADVRQRVFANIAFNVGISGLIGFQKMIAAAKLADWEEAAEQLADSAAAKQLPVRYGRLIAMMRTGSV